MRAALRSASPETGAEGVRLPPLKLVPLRSARILDFDLETLAAGYADPQWVPDKITCAAWSWVGEQEVRSLTTGKDGFFNGTVRGARLKPLLDAIAEADVVTGHNLFRFDLRVLNAECIRCGLDSLRPLMVQDTIRLPRTKGLKKGQDDLSVILGNPLRKKTMNWAEWDAAYEEDRWPEVIERCESDVLQHKALRAKLLERKLLRAPTRWTP